MTNPTAIKNGLDNKLRLSDMLLSYARTAKIQSDRAIAEVHSGRMAQAKSLLKDARKKIVLLKKTLKVYPELYATNMQISLAFQEYVEAEVFMALFLSNKIPQLGVPAECYLTGLADVVGELNRAFLIKLIKNDHKGARKLLDSALWIDDFLKQFNYPDFVVPNLRQKKDYVRAIVDKMLDTFAGQQPRAAARGL